ncbi:alpha/beta fold hydrolase [Nocardia sp. NPDC020380]|uniref:alpha/beta fold hydrolase n=1 Tax=Nocardia sp. NPDC020380 TaxID=3364309 RepID=UPI0037AFFC0E
MPTTTVELTHGPSAVQLRVDQEVDIRRLLPSITAPTVVLVSNHDQIIPPAAQRAVAAAIPHARYRDVDAGHAYPFEDSAEFTSNIVDFVRASG